MILAATLGAVASLTIAFPKAGHVFPYQTRAYMIGATTGGETNLVIQGRDVAVSPTGGWVTMLDLVEGTNFVDVAGSNHWLVVRARPKLRPKSSAVATNVAPKVWKKLEYAADAPQPHPATLVPRPTPAETTIVLDAGHGGFDSGALSPHSLPEKDANLRMVLAVRDVLAKKGYRVVLTRCDDTFVKLYDRPKVAHAEKAAAFVSIHHNAPPTDRDPRAFRYHAVYAWNEIGSRLAAAIDRRIAEALAGAIADNGVPHANFAVTRNPEIPSCLVEVDFITTPEGEVDSWNPARRRRVAAAIAEGIVDWLATPPEPGLISTTKANQQ